MLAVEQLAPHVGTSSACRSLGLSRASLYRRRHPPEIPSTPRATPPRALSAVEQLTVLETLHSDPFVDKAPAEVYATLLDDGIYHCSIRTMYRILAKHDEVRERRDVLRHPNYVKPQLLATGPNQVWSWDITKLLGPVKWTYFYLYVLLDIFSRYVVGWLLADCESTSLAKVLLGESYQKQGIVPGQLVVHADRGPSMKSGGVALLYANLGVTKTHSRPHVSNDNPFSEAHFKILKYRPDFPDRFGCIEDAKAFCRIFFTWYNRQHHHSGLGLMTPFAVHHGLAPQLTEKRRLVLAAAYQAHPDRFVRKIPTPPLVPAAAWINPPSPADGQPAAQKPTSPVAPGTACDTERGVQIPAARTSPQATITRSHEAAIAH
jgi:putative transposase